MRVLKKLLLLSLGSFFLCLVLIECTFTFFNISAERPVTNFIVSHNVLNFVPNQKGINTIGTIGQEKFEWSINNYGWNSNIDYKKSKQKKRVAVIGDSYIEALQVNIENSYPNLLNKNLNEEFEFYSFGYSGSPLSQYYNVSKYVNDLFDPDIVIFNMVENDYDESVFNFFKIKKYFMQTTFENDSLIIKSPTPYNPKRFELLKKILKKSSIIRYINYNTNIRNYFTNLFQSDNESPNHKLDRIKMINKSNNLIIDSILNENYNKKIVFVVDGDRQSIYGQRTNKGYNLNEKFITILKNRNLSYIDLDKIFRDNYLKDSIKFNSELDYHWNSYGHKIIADTLEKYFLNERIN